jgi:hypothetical protein
MEKKPGARFFDVNAVDAPANPSLCSGMLANNTLAYYSAANRTREQTIEIEVVHADACCALLCVGGIRASRAFSGRYINICPPVTGRPQSAIDSLSFGICGWNMAYIHSASYYG